MVNPGVKLRAFDDLDTLREDTLNRAVEDLSNLPPMKYGAYTVRLSKVTSGKPAGIDYDTHKRAILSRGTIGTPIWGNWELYDADDKLVESRRKLIMNLPRLSKNGTYVRKGIEYTVANQQRLRPGVFTLRKGNGELESHFNIAQGTGRQFKLKFDPAENLFDIEVGQAKLPAMPILKALGASDDDLKEAWGDEIFAANNKRTRADVLEKAVERFGGKFDETDQRGADEKLREVAGRMRLDPDVMARTLGVKTDTLSADILKRASKKLMLLHRNEVDPDDRDSLAYQQVVSFDDLLSERIKKDSVRLLKPVMYAIAKKQSLDAIPTAALGKHVDSVILGSGLGQPVEETNVSEVMDQLFRITRMGEGAIGDYSAIPDEARAVQPTYMGFLDPIRTPEAQSVGVDNRIAHGVLKGSDNRLYRKVIDARTGKEDVISAQDAADKVLAFPGDPDPDDDMVPAIAKGKFTRVKRSAVDYVLPSTQDMFTHQVNMMPGLSAISGGRVWLGAKFMSQAMPLVHREAPLVQVGRKEGGTYEKLLGQRLGAIMAEQPGKVLAVRNNSLDVLYKDGTKAKLDLANYLPHNRRSYLKHNVSLKAGDTFDAGQLLASSNLTNDKGEMALGTNLRVAYVPMNRGEASNYEDSIILSESGAKRMAGLEMFMSKLSPEQGEIDKNKFRTLFAGEFNREQLDNIGDNGIVKPGTTLNYGDPIVLAVRSRGAIKPGMGATNSNLRYVNAALKWEHEAPGYVTDSALGHEGAVVSVSSSNPMHVGDKMSGRHGDKGTISSIVPDDQMPRDADGNPFDIVVNPLGVISRSNPAQLVEAWMGKVAAKTGKTVTMPAFTKEDYIASTKKLLDQHGISDTDDIYDPVLNRTIKGVATGNRFYMRLHHLAEKKMSGRGAGAGGYTAEGAPAKGGTESAPRFGLMEVNALIAGNANKVLEDAHLYRGHRNEDYWRAIMLGMPAPKPKQSEMLSKFMHTLAAAGVNVQQRGSRLNLMAMTDADVDKLAKGEITSAETVSFPDLKPADGGLFDRGLTGGHGGDRFTKIEFGAKIPNPVMEEPIRRLLGLTEDRFRKILSGQEVLDGQTGSTALYDALAKINIPLQLEAERQAVKSSSKTTRDNAIKRMRILEAAERTGVRPENMMLSKIPVLPPNYRPISMLNNVPMISPVNQLYKDLIQAKQNYHAVKATVGPANAGEELLTMYDAAKAVTGLGDPVTRESQQKELTGLLKSIFGSTPKHGAYQRKLMGGTVDLGGRGVVGTDPRLDMDHVGVPEDMAWKLYRPFAIRRMVRNGMPPAEAIKAVADRKDVAKNAMLKEMEDRPVMINRAPSLHKYSILGAYPVLTKDKSIKVSPVINPLQNIDHDGDTLAVHVPVSDAAVKEVKEKMMASKQLLSSSNFKAHLVPRQEYQLGLWAATKQSQKKNTKVFATLQDAIRAFKRGELDLDDVVDIPEVNAPQGLIGQLLSGQSS